MNDSPPACDCRIGVDAGGTFTDLVLIDGQGGIVTAKAFSRPDAPEAGVLEVLERAAATAGFAVSEILARTATFAHGTTVSTNALIERKGARVGALFTHGFEDTLAIGRGPVGRVGGLGPALAMDFIHTEPPAPLVPRRMVRGVRERIGSDGEVVVALDETHLRMAVAELLEAGAESLAVCLLWSFRNPAHERRVAEIAQEMAPALPLSLSSEIAPKMGEFERAVTTVVNAHVGPVTERYLASLDTRLGAAGLRTPLQVVTSSGTAARVGDAGRRAVSIINSGPAGGLIAARHLGRELGHDRIITADMGGTSFDVGLIDGGDFEEDPRPYLDQGLPVLLPTARLVTIGAGGGSVIRTDGYRLHVGPESMAADPGPAAYGRGGTRATVTDALIACGIIDPEGFFGGRFRLDPERALDALGEVAAPLGMTALDAAAGAIEVVNAMMANLIRKVSIESGHDPGAFALYAYGGATGAHCAELARQLGIREIVLPHAGPVFSALGVAIADITYSHARSEPTALGAEAAEVATRSFGELKAATRRDMIDAGLDPERCTFRFRIEMRYRNQMNEITIDWPRPELAPADAGALEALFEAEYGARFGAGVARPGTPLELISFRVDASHPAHQPAPAPLAATGSSSSRGTRRVHVRGAGWTDADVIDFSALAPDTGIEGPAVIERDTTTIWVPAGAGAARDRFGNIRLTPEQGP